MHRSISIVIGAIVLVALIFIAFNLRVASDMGVFLPKGQTTLDRLLLSQMDRGASSNMMYVQLGGVDDQTLAALSKQLAKRWTEAASVELASNGEFQLPDSDRDLVIEYRYLLSDRIDADSFSTENLKVAFAERLRGLASPLASLEKQFLRNDPTAEVLSLMTRWTGQQSTNAGPRQHLGVWFSEDIQRAFLILEMATSGLKLDDHENAVAELDAIFTQLAPAGATYSLHGPGVLAADTRGSIRADLKQLSLYSIVGVGLLLMLLFSSPVLFLLLLVPLVCGAVTAVAVVIAVFGSIHGITLAFGVTLIGVAVDYPIHVFSHLKDGSDKVSEHVAKIWPTLRLGVMTTIIAYAALVMSDLTGLQQLGVFTVTGLLTAAAVTRWILPLISPQWLRVGHRAGMIQRVLEKFGRSAHRIWPLAIVVALASALVLAFSGRTLLDTSVDSLSPLPLERRANEHVVRNEIGVWTGGKLMIATGSSSQSVLEYTEALVPRLEALVQDGAISGFDMAASFLPSIARQEVIQQNLPTQDELRDRVIEASTGLPFKQGIFDPFLVDVQKAKEQSPIDLSHVMATSAGSRFGALIFEHEGDWIAPILLHGVEDEVALRQLEQSKVDTKNEHELLYLNLKGETNRIMASVMAHIAWVMLVGAAFIYLLLLVVTRSLTQPLRVLVPTAASVLTVSAILIMSGLSLTLFHLVSLLLVVGLGLDYSLFFNRLAEHGEEWATTYRSIWICCLTTVIVFGVLSISKTPPLHTVGVTVAMGAALCFMFGAILATQRPDQRASAD